MSLTILLAAQLASGNMSLPPATPAKEVRSSQVTGALEEVFADPAFAFCHDESYPLSNKEYRWCAQVTGAPTACPRFKTLCDRGASAVKRERPRPLPSFDLPDLGGIAKLALWVAVGGAAGLVVWLILRNLIKGQAQPVPSPRPANEPLVAARRADAVVETDVQRLLDRAREAVSAGDVSTAVAFAHAAMLRRLEGQGLVKVHRSRTTSDYLRELGRAAPQHQAAVAEVLHAVDRAQYAAVRPSSAFVESLIAHVVNLNAAIRPIALLLLFLLSGGCNLQSRDGWEHSPSGVEAVVRFLQKTGLDARERLSPLAKISDETGQLVLLPSASLSEEDWSALEGWVWEGGRLILAPGPRELPDWLPLAFDSTTSTGLRELLDHGPTNDATVLQLDPALEKRLGPLKVAAPVDRVLSGETLESELEGGIAPLLSDDHGVYAAEVELEAGTVLVFADRNLFSNASLLIADNARFLRAMLEEGDGRVELVGDLAGIVSPNPVASVSRGKMAPFMAQLALFLVVLFLSRGTLFGSPKALVRAGRRRFAEHVLAVGLQYRRAQAARHALATLGHYLVERLRQRARLSGQGGVGALADSLARQGNRSVHDLERFVRLAREDQPLAKLPRRTVRDELGKQADALAALSAMLSPPAGITHPTPRGDRPRVTQNHLPAERGEVRITTSRSRT